MNKLFFALFLVMFVGAMGLAEEAPAPEADNAATSVLVSGEGVHPAPASGAPDVKPEASGVDNTAISVLVSGEGIPPAQASSAPVVAPKAPDSATAVIPEKPLTFTGIVDSVSSSQIVLNNGKGEQTPFAVASDVTVIDKDGNTKTLIWISKGTKVSIEYITAEGSTKIVKSIKVLSAW